MANERKQIGAGWVKSTDRGEYIAVSFKKEEIEGLDLSECWVSIVVNNKKAKQNHPDYFITATLKEQQAKPTPRPPAQQKSAFPRPQNFAPKAQPRFAPPTQQDDFPPGFSDPDDPGPEYF